MQSRRQFLKQYREVRPSEKTSQFKSFDKTHRGIFGETITRTIRYRVYDIEQTKKIKKKEDRHCIDFFLKYCPTDKISSCSDRAGNFTWKHSSYKLTWRDIKRHMWKSKKKNNGRIGYVCDKYDHGKLHNVLIIDVDCPDASEYWTKIEKMKSHYDAMNIGSVVIANIDEVNCRGFHVYIFPKKPIKQCRAIAFLQTEKQNDKWIDKYYPNDTNQGIRGLFDYDRKFFDHTGKLSSNNWLKIKRTIENGSKIKKIKKPRKTVNVGVKNIVRTGSVSDIKFRGKFYFHIKKMYEVAGYDDYNRSGSCNIDFAYKWNSGAIKAYVMSGATDTEILNHIGTSLYVSRRFDDIKERDWLRIIRKCRIQVDDENDPINKIWHCNRPYLHAVLSLWQDGISSEIERKEIVDIEPDARCVRQLADAIYDKFGEKSLQYAKFILILCKRDRSPRKENAALLKKLGLNCGNDAVRDITEWMREKGFVDAPISRQYGKATSYRATPLLQSIIALREEIAAIDLPEADQLVAAIDNGNEDEILVGFFILLLRLQNIPDYLLTAREKSVLFELRYLRFALLE